MDVDLEFAGGCLHDLVIALDEDRQQLTKILQRATPAIALNDVGDEFSLHIRREVCPQCERRPPGEPAQELLRRVFRIEQCRDTCNCLFKTWRDAFLTSDEELLEGAQ